LQTIRRSAETPQHAPSVKGAFFLMKILVIGHLGQLGKDMLRAASSAEHAVSGVDFPDIDITVPASVQNSIAAHAPDVIVNCAAFTAVDQCETKSAKAFAANAEGVANIGLAATEHGATVVHLSTDYVFDGTKKSPYVETDSPNPLSVYGKSKLAGEQRLMETCSRSFILRIAWLYGTRGNNFLKTIRGIALKRAETHEQVNVVNDQVGTPTYTVHVCRQILSLIETDLYGLYHSTNEGLCSWFDFARAIVRAYRIPVVVAPCTTAEFLRLVPQSAPRPANSVLENERLKKAGLNIMPPWEQGLEEYVLEEKSQEGNRLS
jgi:dTDP-4-dehydrorhamnose reductase